jgi:hypothetical protein
MPTTRSDRSAPGIQEASVLIGDIYDAALDAALWPAVLEKICSFIGGAVAVLMSESAVSEKGRVYYASGSDPDWIESYFKTYIHLNPLRIPALLHAGVDDVFRLLVHDSRGVSIDPIHKEWIQPKQH